MEVVVGNGSERGGRRERSPERERVRICRRSNHNHNHNHNHSHSQKVMMKPSRKVQVVYYLSRNGLLEHPHFMELNLFPNQPLRLKDVLDRLMALRGPAMPLQYSWSSKRNYKSGYVWCDLSVKDIIHPAEGGEYVLKGSELLQPDRFNATATTNKQPSGIDTNNYNYDSSRTKTFKKYEEYEEEDEDEEEEEEGEKTSYTSSTTPHSRCSRGVSTEEVVYEEEQKKKATKLKQEGGSDGKVKRRERVEGGDGSVSNRYSLLLQLIACGSGSGSAGELKGPRLSDVGTKDREREKKISLYWDNEILNPNLQTEDKEYFSGSLLDSIKPNPQPGDPVLKRSNSYNELRRSRLGMEEVKPKVIEEDKRVVKGGIKDKCIPLIKSPKQTVTTTASTK